MITIRDWNLLDAEFMLQCRNNPNLMRWYRQDKKLTLKEQKNFMQTHYDYKGYIVERGIGKPVGFVALSNIENDRAEFSIGILPKHQGHGFAKEAMKALEAKAKSLGVKVLCSEVFIDNPAIAFYLKLGYKLVGVHGRAYYKKNVGLIDVVNIEKQL